MKKIAKIPSVLLATLSVTLLILTLSYDSSAQEKVDPREYASGQYGVNLLKGDPEVEEERVSVGERSYGIFNSFTRRYKNANDEMEVNVAHRFNASAKEIAAIQGEEPKDFCQKIKDRLAGEPAEVESCLIGLYNYDLHVTGLGETPFDGSRDLWIAARIKFSGFGNVVLYLGYKDGEIGSLGVH